MTEFDNDQKPMIFKGLAKMEFPFHHPKFKNPGVMYHLKTNLKENLNQLSETSVLNIIGKYFIS